MGTNLDRALRRETLRWEIELCVLENQLCVWQTVTNACNTVEERRFSAA